MTAELAGTNMTSTGQVGKPPATINEEHPIAQCKSNMETNSIDEKDSDEFHSASSNDSIEYCDAKNYQNETKESNKSHELSKTNVADSSNCDSTSSGHSFQISPIIQGDTLKAFIIKPLTEFSAATRQFFDLLDLASGNTPSGGYSFLKDRINSLMKYATRKTRSTSQGPKWSGLGVGNIVRTVENRSKKQPEPELRKRGKFVAKKGNWFTDTKKKAGKWQSEVSKGEFANIPQLSLAEQLRAHMNALPFRHKKQYQEETIAAPVTSGEDEDYLDVNTRKGGMTLTSLIESIDDGSFNFEILTELEKMERLAQDPIIDDSHENSFSVNTRDQNFPGEASTSKNDEIDDESEHITDEDGNSFIFEKPLEIHENENLDQFIEETKEDTLSGKPSEFTVTSINEIFANEYESVTEKADEKIQYFLEEECVMLSPYSNEAKLYKLLFPGQKIPVKKASESIEYSVEESTEEILDYVSYDYQMCIERTSSENNIAESATVFELPVLTSPYTDDMWISESDSDEQLREPTPPPKEPTPPPKEPTPPPKEPTPPPKEPTPPPREPTPPLKQQTPPPKEPTPPPKEPTPPPKDPTPPPQLPKKVKRKPPEKKKKVYDRNFVKAVQMNQIDVVQQLLWEGADPDTSCSIGTVLHQAAQLGFSYVVQNLLWGGSETEMRNELGDTALHLAAIAGHNDIVLMLTVHGCDIDACNNYDITPLHMALSYGKLAVIQTLVRMNADPFCKDRIGDTAHSLVTQLGYPKETLDSAAAENGPISKVPAPLLLVLAVENGSLSQVEEALAEKASPNTIVPLALHWPGHSTVLHRAAHLGYTDIVLKLLLSGSDPSARDLTGNTPLHTAVQDGHDEVVKVLVENGADVNAVTKCGVTPLHRAAAKGHESTMMLLLMCGANPNLKDNQNKTALEWARQKGFMVLARNLNRYMG